MFRSDETFAGAAKLEKNGAFAMKLNERKGSNADGPEKNIGFPGELKANKSFFSFGEKLICIGTGISSIDKVYPVQTNIFQNFLFTTVSSPSILMIKAEGKDRLVISAVEPDLNIPNLRKKRIAVIVSQLSYHSL